MPAKTIEHNDEILSFSEEELFAFSEDEEDDLKHAMTFNYNSQPHKMANSSSASTVNIQKNGKNCTASDAQKNELHSVEDTPDDKKDYNSNYIGAHRNAKREKYEAIILYKKKRIFLGRFDIEKDAAIAYDKAAFLLGKNRNFPDQKYSTEEIEPIKSILARKDILMPEINKHHAIPTEGMIKEKTVPPVPTTKEKHKKIISDLTQLINEFKDKWNLFFCSKEMLAPKDKTPKYKGQRPKNNLFATSITTNNQYIHIGSFDDKISAAIAYDFTVKVLNLKRTLNFREDIYTEEDVKACEKIILPLIEDKKNQASKKLNLATNVPGSTSSETNTAAETTKKQNKALTYAYDKNTESASSSSLYKTHQPPIAAYNEISKKHKKARIDK